MRRPDARFLAGAAFLCLPTLAVFALALRFLAVDVPKIVSDERSRVAAETERAATDMRADPAAAEFAWERGKGVVRGGKEWSDMFPASLSWRDWNPASGTKRKDMWGWRSVPGGGRLVWVRGLGAESENFVWGRRTEIEERDWAFTFYFFGPAFLFVLLGVTWMGVRYFADYVRTRDDFMSATAHDLKTPLAAMRNLIGTDDAEARNINERMVRIVCNITDFLMMGGRRKPPERIEFDLLAAYDEAYALFREDYRDLFEGEDVARDVSALADPRRLAVRGDLTMTVQILWNLLGNDLKYAAPFGRVKAVFSEDGGFARLDLVDGGKGMSRHEMSRAFDRYYRAKTILESGKGGFGIGLCTSREFAEAMGGSLTVRSNSPRGCVFTLCIPKSPGVPKSPAGTA